MGGKRGGSKSVVVGYNYFASFAGLAGYGPADALVELIVDAKSVWRSSSPIQRRFSSNPYVFDVSGRGRVYFYWGTADQVLSDPVLTKPGRSHPAYRHRVLLVFEDFECGFERLSVPDVQVVYRRAADQQLILGSLAAPDDGQVNPAASILELLSSPMTGIGLPPGRIHEASWRGLATSLHAERQSQYLSVFLDQRMRLREILEEVSGTADSWFRINEAGQLAAGRFATGAAPEDLPVLTEHDLTKAPDITAHGYGELDDRLTLSYRDRARAYGDAQVRFDSPKNRGLLEAGNGAETRRPWITRSEQAATQAVQIGLRQSSPWDGLKLSVREARVLLLGLHQGSQFVFSYGPLNYRAICRVLSINGFADGGGPVQLEAETERSLGPAAFTPDVAPPVFEEEDPVEPLAYFDVIQATPELAGGETYRVAPLAARHQRQVRSADIWWRQSDSVEFTELGAMASFAVPVELATSYAATEPLEDTSGALQVRERTFPQPVDRITDLEAAQSTEQIADDNLLLVLLGPTGYEVLTIRSIESPTGGVFPLHVNRARLGTERLAHAAGAPGYLIERGELILLTSSAFESVALSATVAERTAYFKAAPSSVSGSLDVVDAPEVALELAEQEVLAVNQVATPEPSILEGEQPFGSFPLAVGLSVATTGAVLRWSKTAVPNSETEGSAYVGAVAIDSGDTLYAKAFKAGMLPSNALIATYTEAPEPDPPPAN